MMGEYRELTVVRPYVLVYDIDYELIRILRVWRSAQQRN
ncbi:hypothetical protein WCLP8_1920002 [uncultured Gammaproteobacteria bacterium]